MPGSKETKAERRATKAERREQKLARIASASPQVEGESESAVAAYERENRDGANQEGRKLLAENPPSLGDLQLELVDRLRSDGIAQVSFPDLFSRELWEELVEEAARFTLEVEDKLQAEGRSGEKRVRKGGPGGFIRRRHEGGVELAADDLWLRIALAPQLLDVVNAYLGMWAKLTYCDQWYTVPMPEGAARKASQNWHRDHVDKHLVKVFIYLSDVDESSGPFEYVPGSTGDGPYANVWPWAPGGDHYPPQEKFDQLIPAAAVRTLTGPAGTMILCNTSGFHRGGFAIGRPRILWRYNFSSPASLSVTTKRRFVVDSSRLPAELPRAALYALT